MSYSNNQPPRRTAPLIQRPSAASASASSSSTSSPNAHLAGSIANAFAGMGYSYPNAHYNPAFHPHLPPNPSFQQPPYIPQVPQYPIHYPQGPPMAAYGQPSYATQGYPVPAPAAGPSASPYPYTHAAAAPGPSQQSVQILPQRHGLPARPPLVQQQQHQLKRPRTLDGKAAAAASGSNSALPLPYQDDQHHAPSAAAAAGPPRTRIQQRGPEVIRCCKDDCTFTGSRKAVREHEEDRHLIFAPGREPKPWNGSLKPVDGSVIEGTGISLDTPEALARWIEERKKRWPSKKVVEEKEKARAERIAAGLEAPPRERGGGRGRGRGRGGPSDFSARGARGRGGLGRGGYVGGAHDGEGGSEQGLRAQGKTETVVGQAEGEPSAAKRLKMSEAGRDGGRNDNDDDFKQDAEEDDDDDDDDDDDGAPEEMAAKPPMAVESLPTKPVKAEGEASSSAPPLEEQPADRPERLDSDVDGSAAGQGEEERGGGGEPAPKRFQVVCRHWRKGNCALGDVECPYLHHLPPNAGPPPPPKRRRPAPPPAPHNPFARPAGFSDPFSLVEERDHRHIVADVLQVIEFLGANDWLQGVEIRRGQVDEESGIQVLGETTPDEAVVVGERQVDEEPKQPAAIVEISDGADEKVLPQSSTLDLSSDVSRQATAPTRLASNSDATASVSALSKSPTTGAGIGLFADYGSDSEDDEEAVEQAVASALLPTAP